MSRHKSETGGCIAMIVIGIVVFMVAVLAVKVLWHFTAWTWELVP